MRDAMRQDTECTTDILAQLKRHNNVQQKRQKDTPHKENSHIHTHDTTSMAQQSSNDSSSQTGPITDMPQPQHALRNPMHFETDQKI